MSLEQFVLGGVKIAKSILLLDFTSQIDRVRIDQALQSLRQIYFFPSELQKSLATIADGGIIEQDIARYFAERYRSISADIGEAFEFLKHDLFNASRRVLLSDTQLMQAIRHQKIDVRSEISRLFERYIETQGTERRGNDVRLEAARLIAQIERLNRSIEECEAKLLAARDAPHSIIASRASSSVKKAVKIPKGKR